MNNGTALDVLIESVLKVGAGPRQGVGLVVRDN